MKKSLTFVLSFLAAIILMAGFFSYIYGAFNMLSQVLKLTTALLLYLLVALSCYFLISKYKLKRLYIHIIIFFISMSLQLLICSNYTFLGEGDLRYYYSNALKILEGNFSYISLYAATFPGTVTYPTVLAALMGMFGTSRTVAAIANCISVSFALCCIYTLLEKRINKRFLLAFCLIIPLNPYISIYSNTTNAELIFGSFIVYSITFFDKAVLEHEKTKQILFYLLSALFLGFSLLFRPLGIILLIAYCIVMLLSVEEKVFKRIFIITLYGIVFFFLSQFNSFLVRQVTSFDAPKFSYGWNLYVGLSESGRWNQTDGKEFSEVFFHASTPTEIQEHFAQKSLDRLNTMGAHVVLHGVGKLDHWYSVDYISSQVLLEDVMAGHSMRASRNLITILAFIFDIPIFVFGLLGCIFALIRYKKQHDIIEQLMAFYFTGSFLIFFFIELASRHTISHHILMILPALLFFHKFAHSIKPKISKLLL
ncbi:MAG: glycosyltransferase family 39 protein [Oscillospiraceae bacterium]|jgi:hypothetical protein|nr:glycosyltransferase family 39 protein [Oscillospiraceae bacterium]